MKCSKCGSELELGAKFCRECGAKVESDKRYCRECGAELLKDAKFCSKCGTKVLDLDEMTVGENNNAPDSEETIKEDCFLNSADSDISQEVVNSIPSQITEMEDGQNQNCSTDGSEEHDEYIKTPEVMAEKSDIETKNSKIQIFIDNIKNKFLELWNKFDLFLKTGTVIAAMVLLLMFISLITKKLFPMVISLIQIVLLVVAALIHLNKITVSFKGTKFILLVLAVLLIFGNIFSYSIVNKSKKPSSGSKPDNETVIVENKVRTPYSSKAAKEKGINELSEDLSLVGFKNINKIPLADLSYEEGDKNDVVESITINSIADFEGNQEFLDSSIVEIKYHSYKLKTVPIDSNIVANKTTDSLIDMFHEAGFVNIKTDEMFDIDPDQSDAEFSNTIKINGEENFNITSEYPLDSMVEIITHRPYEKFSLKVIIDFVPNLIFSTYDVDMKIGSETIRMEHGNDGEYEFRLQPSTYEVEFTSTESSARGSATLELSSDIEVSYKIACYNDEITVDLLYLENESAIGENEAMIPASSSTCKYKNYEEVQSWFVENGFTNIETEILYDIVFGWTDEGEVEKVTVNGVSDFARGEIYSVDIPIVITYHMKEEDDPNKPVETETNTEDKDENKQSTTSVKKPKTVSYSTNTSDTVKDGDKGVYSYKRACDNYDIYYIIDFDEGYVYYFLDGNGDTACDKVAIESGNLNDGLILTYHDGSSTWQECLHFKWYRQPDHLILQDANYFEWDYYSTNLSDAKSIRNEKTIYEY